MFYTDLKPGVYIVLDNQPFVVLEYDFVRMQQRKPVVKTKIKNIITGAISERSFQPSDDIKEAEIEKMPVKFLYQHRGEFWFCEINNPKNRFMLKEDILASITAFLKPELEVIALKFFGQSRDPKEGKIFNIEIPIKVDYKVIEAPPSIRGNTSQGGTKIVVIETGLKVSTPLFIQEGDVIKVNTQTGEYVERV